MPPSQGESCGPQIVADQTNKLSSECGDAEQPCVVSRKEVQRVSETRIKRRTKHERKRVRQQRDKHLMYLPRAVRSVSNANRTVISNTPTRSSDWIPECSPAAETSRENYSTPVFVSRSSLFQMKIFPRKKRQSFVDFTREEGKEEEEEYTTTFFLKQSARKTNRGRSVYHVARAAPKRVPETDGTF